MKIQKHHFYLLPILLTAAFSLAVTFSALIRTWAQTTVAPATTTTMTTAPATTTNTATTTTTAPPTCSFSYSSWSSCSTSGVQTRTITSKSPSGCVGGSPEPLSKTCTFTPPTCAYTYSDWGGCDPSGHQGRSVTSMSPSGCVGTPETYRSCTYVPNTAPTCTYTYSEWGGCDTSGHQGRAVTSATPAGCTGTPETYRSCTYTSTTVPCTFTYSDWSSCSSTGMQYRTVTSKTPSGCAGGSPETLSRTCTFVPPTAETTTVPICSFSYSAWSACSSSGVQTRTITSKSPSNCTGGSPEPLSKTCVPPATATATTTAVSTMATALNCTPSCTVWSACSADGYRLRTCSAPSGCPSTSWTEKNYCASTATTAAATMDATMVPTCVYQCSPWSDCLAVGYQERKCQKPTETSCFAYPEKRACLFSGTDETATTTTTCAVQCSEWSVCSPAGMKARSCWPSPSTCGGETKTETATCVPLVCRFAYSDWGACQNGMRFRSILSASPADCVGGEPVLKEACTTSGEEGTAPAPVIETVPASVPVDPEIVPTAEWKKNVFQTEECRTETCLEAGDPDRDGLNNKDEYRFGTDPLSPDTDRDGKKDGEEVARGTDPLKSSAKGEADEVVYENPQESGTVKEEIYQVHTVEMVADEGADSPGLKVAGKGPAETYLNVYIYSENPVIVTVKTDANGDWSYVVDQSLEDGNHEVYVAITSNTGAVKSKSQPLPFVKSAQAVSIPTATAAETAPPAEELPRPGKGLRSILFLLAAAAAGLALALILIGSAVKKSQDIQSK